MNTQEYLSQVRAMTGFTNYKIGKELDISQANISNYSTGKKTISEAHSFQFSEILGINPSKIIADTKLENAINKNDAKKIEFWLHQVERLTDKKTEKAQLKKIKEMSIKKLKDEFEKNMSKLKHGLASVVVFSMVAFTPFDETHAQEINEPVTQGSAYFILC